MRKDGVIVGGVWLRRSGDKLQVLAETLCGDGTYRWRVVITERWPSDGEAEISHIVEPSGIKAGLVDTLDSR